MRTAAVLALLAAPACRASSYTYIKPYVEEMSASLNADMTTHRLGVYLQGDAENAYSLVGSAKGAMTIPAAWHKATFGKNIGGVHPDVIKQITSAAYDSWLTVGIVGGDSSNELGSTGLTNDLNAWTPSGDGFGQGFTNADCGVFWMNPPTTRAKGSGKIVLAQLTVKKGEVIRAQMGVVGKTKDGAQWREDTVKFSSDGAKPPAPSPSPSPTPSKPSPPPPKGAPTVPTASHPPSPPSGQGSWSGLVDEKAPSPSPPPSPGQGGGGAAPTEPVKGDDNLQACCKMGAKEGKCVVEQGICTKESRPVCGCDGKTYSNAGCAGLTVQSFEAGACGDKPGSPEPAPPGPDGDGAPTVPSMEELFGPKGGGKDSAQEIYNQTEVTGLGSDGTTAEDFVKDFMKQQGEVGEEPDAGGAVGKLLGLVGTQDPDSAESKETALQQCDACMAVSGPVICARVCKGSQNMPPGMMLPEDRPAMPECKNGVCEVKTCTVALNSTGHWVQKCTTQMGVDLGDVRAGIKFDKVTRNVSYAAKITSQLTNVKAPWGTALNVSYDTVSLSGSERDNILGSMALKAGEEMKVDCGPDGCDLCKFGCKMEEGSVVKVSGGTVRLPPGSASSPMMMDLAAGAKMQIDRDQELLGNIEGALEVGAGTTTLAGVTGSANISVSKGARVIFAGSGDSAMRMDIQDGAELVLSGTTKFTAGMTSTGLLNITGGAAVEFAGDKEAVISGAGIESFGDIGVGAAGLRMRGPMRSLGVLNITAGSTMKFQPQDEASVVLTGDVNNISDVSAFKAQFQQDVATKLSIAADDVEIVSVSNKQTSGRRRVLGTVNSTAIAVSFTIKPPDQKSGPVTYDQIMTNLAAAFSGDKPLSLGGLPATSYARTQQAFASVIGGQGLSLAHGATLQVDAGNVTFEGALDSAGMLNIAKGGRVTFASAGTNTVGGEGMVSAVGSTVAIGKGELNVKGTFTSAGDVDIGAGAKLTLNSTTGTNVMSGPATKIGKGAELELSTGLLKVDSDMASEGLFAVTGGTVDFGKVGGKNVIGGAGMTVTPNSMVGISAGTVSFDAPMVSTGKVEVGKSGKVNFGDVPRQSQFTFVGALPTGKNLTAFKAQFAKDVASILQIPGAKPEDKVKIASVTANKASGGRRRLAVANSTFFRVAFSFDLTAGTYKAVLADSIKRVVGPSAVGTPDGDAKLKQKLESLTVLGIPVTSALANVAGKPNIIGGKGMAVAAGGTVELAIGSVVGFKQLNSSGLIDIKKDSVATFASADLKQPTTLKGDGLKTAASSKVDVAAGIVNVEGPLRSSGKISVGSMAQLGVTVSDGAKEDSVVSGDGLSLDGGLFLSTPGGNRRRMSASEKKTPQLTIAGQKGLVASNTSKIKVQTGARLTFATDGSRPDGSSIYNELKGPVQLDQLSELTVGDGSKVVISELSSAGVMKLGPNSRAKFDSAPRTQADGTVASTQSVFKGAKGTGLVSVASSAVDVSSGVLRVEAPLHSGGKLYVQKGATLSIQLQTSETSDISGDGLGLVGTMLVSSGSGSLGSVPALKVSGTTGLQTAAGSRLLIQNNARLSIETSAVDKTAKQSVVGGAFGLQETAELEVSTGSNIEFEADTVSSSSKFTAKEGSIVSFGGKTNLNQLESSGTISLSTSTSSTGRRRLNTKPGATLVIGDAGLKSMGHLIVPTGGSLTFNSNSAASIIAGKGLDNHGNVVVLKGAIDVQAGGIRSTSKGSSIAVKGGKLEFSSTEPSLIGGKGITIDSAASVAVKRGTVGFTAEMLGKVAVESSAKVLLSKSSGSTCASFSGGTCKDKVEDLKLAADGKLTEASDSKPQGVGVKVASAAHAGTSGLLLVLSAAAILW